MVDVVKGDLNALYEAQTQAGKVNYPNIFPCYSKKHLDKADGFMGGVKRVYAVVYDVACFLSPLADAVSYVATKFFELLDTLASPLLDQIMPINPVNGKRHFIGIPKTWEINLGKVLYTSVTGSYTDVEDHVMVDGKPMGKMIHDIFHKLADDNPDVLNPDKETPFEYRVRTVQSDTVNAFAVMGGGMCVLSKIVELADETIKSGKYDDIDIEFADGSVATVDMRGVKLEDAMAALMGHEMTHVASRHSIVHIIGNLFRLAAVFIASIFVTVKVKENDAEYQEIKRKPLGERTGAEQKRLQEKEEGYDRMRELIQWIGSKIGGLFGLYHSRKDEYEADNTGLHLAHNAGYDGRGAILLQRILLEAGGGDGTISNIHRKFEWLFTHPHSANRMRGALAALSVTNEELVRKHVTWKKPADDFVCKFDTKRSDASVTFAADLRNKLAATTG